MREQATRRAERHAVTLPLLTTMTAAGVGAELRMLADDHEALLHAVGMNVVSPLRNVAERLPRTVDTATGMILRSERSWADLLGRLADRANTDDADPAGSSRGGVTP